MKTGTLNNYVQFSNKFGGVRKCYEGKPVISVGGYSIDLEDMPARPNALPAGTPVYADDQARTVVPLYTFKVLEVDTVNSAVKVEKFETGSVAKVGMVLATLNPFEYGDALPFTCGDAVEVTAVDASNEGYDILTVSGLVPDSDPVIAAGDVIVEVIEDDNDNIVPKIVPNALTYCDNVLDPDAYAMDIDVVWNCTDKAVLERRMPPLVNSLKKALLENGCFFRFSNRK